jgi:hypothetical protein
VLKKSASGSSGGGGVGGVGGPEAIMMMPLEQQSINKNNAQQQQQQQQQNNVSAYEYDEIDQIYDYVRGLASLPKNLNNFESLSESSPIHSNSKLPPHSQKCSDVRQTGSSKVVNSQRYASPQDPPQQHKRENNNHHHHHHHNHHHNLFNSDSWIKHELLEKPIPPTIKTIPSKKQLSQKRPTLIFARSNNSHGPKVPSSSSPPHHQQQQQQQQKESSSAELSPQSPLFHIR